MAIPSLLSRSPQPPRSGAVFVFKELCMNNINDLSNLQPTDLDAGQVFSGKPSGTTVRGYAVPSAYTPAIDHDYIFHESSRDVVVWFLNAHEPLYVFGPTGCGKTSCIKQLAARLNYPVFEVTGHGRLEFADLVGHLSVKDGNMTFEYGMITSCTCCRTQVRWSMLCLIWCLQCLQ